MEIRPVFRAVHLPTRVRQTLEILTPKNTSEYINADFAGFDLAEIIQLAKTNDAAKEEYILRIHRQIEIAARNYHLKKKYISEDDIYLRLADTAMAAVKIYNPEKGDVVHLLNRMFKIAYRYLCKEKAADYERELRYFGTRIRDSEICTYPLAIQNAEDEKKKLDYKLQLEDYMKYITEKERGMLTLYSYSLTFDEIGKKMGLPTSTVSNSIYRMIAELKNRMGVID